MIPRSDKTGTLETSSILSAFVSALVLRNFKHELLETLSSIEKEAYLMHLMLGAQQITYEILPDTKEWDMQDSVEKVIVLARKHQNYSANLSEVRLLVVRMNLSSWINSVDVKHQFDRVTSLVLFSTSRYDEIALTFTMSRGEPFAEPSKSTINPQESFPPFINTKTNTTSKLFTSAAELMVLYEHSDGSAKLNYLVSASGSLRTVEAVSSVVIRMAVDNKSPGEAIAAPCGYYDPRDGLFYCEHSQAEVLKVLREKYGISCHPIPSNDPEITDRFVSAIQVKEDYYKRVLAAVSQRKGDVNFAAGF
ncbi:hypothetical protein KIN20_001778 [Parelaphostrongylus tenuis]|uniref:Uncharacterized protein n=1 Tax=Parelaphostrongylus tenuis TaxID=148309 RepID=A0AAD5MFS8_PARTN|nr:hypothetical protein KIN20_001778 [Parelaphostrongylus tenuis]